MAGRARIAAGRGAEAPSGNGQVWSGGHGPKWEYPPGHEVDYAAFTAAVNITASTEATSQVVVTGASIHYDGLTAIMLDFFSPYVASDPFTGHDLTIILYDSLAAASVGRLAYTNSDTAFAKYVPVRAGYRFTPSAGTHTYSVRAFCGQTPSSNATIGAGVGGNGNEVPGYMRITLV